MFYYIDQPRTPPCPTGLVKTGSDFIVRSVETDLERRALVLAVVSVDTYPFFSFLKSDLSPWEYRNRWFLLALCCLIVRSHQTSSPSTDKNTGVYLVPCRAWKCVIAISGGVDISEVTRCHLLRQMSSQWESQKLLRGLLSHELSVYLLFSVFDVSFFFFPILYFTSIYNVHLKNLQ